MSFTREHGEVTGNCEKILVAWIAGSTTVPSHEHTHLKSGGESSRRIADAWVGFVMPTLCGMSGWIVSVLTMWAVGLDMMVLRRERVPEGRAKTLSEGIVSALQAIKYT